MQRDCYVYVIEQKGQTPLHDVALYVGVGKGNRMHSHLRNARKGVVISKNGGAVEKQQYLIELIRNGEPVAVRKLKENLKREDAYKIEMQFITLYGRRGLGTGSLLNANAGGFGGRDPIPSTLVRMSAAQRGRKISLEHRAKISAMNSGRKHTPDSCANMSASHRDRWTPEEREKIGALKRGKKFTPEHRAKIASANRGNKSNLGKKFTPEHAAKIAAALRGRKHTPEAKAKMSAARRARSVTLRTSPAHRVVEGFR